MRRIARVFGLVAAVAAGTLLAAPSAGATSYTVDACDFPTHNYKFPDGSTVVVQATGTCHFALPTTEGSGNVWLAGGSPTSVSSVDGAGQGTVTFTIHSDVDWFAVRINPGGWNVPYIGACGADSSGWVDPLISYCDGAAAGDSATPPPSWYQSYQRPSMGAVCIDGWNPSWAEWANGGKGGSVCDREEYWNGAAQAWAFR